MLPDEGAGFRGRRWSQHLAVFALYALASLLIFGRGASSAPQSHVVGDAGADKTIFMWSLRWWPHAIGRGHDPFSANVVWVPHGIDLSWVTSVPLLSVVLSPVTALAGAVAAYNVAILAAPAVNGLAAYLLARRLVGRFVPAVGAGWVFGFSAYELGHMMGHLNLAFAPFIPLAVVVAVKYVLGDLRPKGFVVLLGLTLAAEFLTSTELYLDLLLVGVLFIAVFYAVDAARRERLNELIRFGGVGVALSLLIVSPYLWHAFVSSGIENAPLRSPYSEATDLANFVVPTRLVWLQLPGSARIAGHFTATGAERGGYLGIPLLVVMLLYVWRSRSVPAVRALAIGFALTALATLGSEIRVGGHSVVPAPWRVLAKLPVTRTILPVRLTVFLALLAALAVAAFLARSGVWGWALVGLGVLFLLPNPAGGRWNSPVPNPRFFASRLYRDHVPRRANVLAFPYGGAGWSLLWQAEDGFSYNLVGGHFGRTTIPAERRWKRVYVSFGFHQDPDVTPAVFKRFVAAHRIGTITVATGTTFHVRRLVASLGVRPKRSGDVLVYTLS